MHSCCVGSNKDLYVGKFRGTFYPFLLSGVVQDPPRKMERTRINLDWLEHRTTQAVVNFPVCYMLLEVPTMACPEDARGIRN